MKTEELSGAALDYAVAICEGYKKITRPLFMKGVILHYDKEEPYSPSRFWNDGGPIIEREKIGIEWYVGQWCAFREPVLEEDETHGSTPLEAAMRFYVWKTLGYEVDIPEEFLK